MKHAFWLAALLAGALLSTGGTAQAGGKPDGATCHVSKSCRSQLCVRQNPLDKFGVCCAPLDCPAQNAQCGSIDNGCGVPIDCGTCGFGFDCVSNQCQPSGTTTTSTTTSTTSTTSTSTTSSTTTTSTTSTTTTTQPPGTTTTTTTQPPSSTSTTVPVEPSSCAGVCGSGEQPSGCWCDEISCSANDGCPDRDSECPTVCAPTTTLADTCFGSCGFQAPSGCWCDDVSCGEGDGCPDRDEWCPGICDPPATTSTTIP